MLCAGGYSVLPTDRGRYERHRTASAVPHPRPLPPRSSGRGENFDDASAGIGLRPRAAPSPGLSPNFGGEVTRFDKPRASAFRTARFAVSRRSRGYTTPPPGLGEGSPAVARN